MKQEDIQSFGKHSVEKRKSDSIKMDLVQLGCKEERWMELVKLCA
jgi:arabinogalactan endo-1,4-beta-galactosidase